MSNESVPAVVTHSDPRAEVARAHEMAKVLRDVVRQAQLSKAFTRGGKEHLFFEAWQTIGRFFSCAAEVEWSRPIWHAEKIVGWEARARVVDADGRVIAAAESMCGKDEQNWRDRPAYAIRSMAQTRASSKALRQAFAWVAVLAGYSPTPAEEMDGVEPIADAQGPNDPSTKSSESNEPWTDAQRRAIWAKCLAAGLDRDGAKAFVNWALSLSGAESWTKRYAQSVIDDFDGMMSAYLETQGTSDDVE